MRRKAVRLLFFVIGGAAIGAGALTTSCGSNYTTTPGDASTDGGGSKNAGGSAAPGSLGGDCYPNKTCDQGLTCNSAASCVRPDGTSQDAGNGDTTGNGGDASLNCPAIVTLGDSCFLAGGGPASGYECITQTGGSYNATCGGGIDGGADCTSLQQRLNCLTSSDCKVAGGGGACCISVAMGSSSASGCDVSVKLGGTPVSSCLASCGAAYTGCRTSADCEGKRCLAVSADPQDPKLSIFGICAD